MSGSTKCGIQKGQRGVDSARSQMVSAWVAVVQLDCLIGTRETGPLWQTRTRGFAMGRHLAGEIDAGTFEWR